jgi:DNA-binding winged helix-turn-helix (wHTH) protein/tetratricopeptide (TPR) repeat protein
MNEDQAMSSASIIRFGAFELQLETGEVRKHGRRIKLPPQSFRLLVLLARSPGQLVSRDAIQKEIWGGETFVDFEHGLNFCIRQIRDVLGESARKPRFIETLPRRGYRFIVEASSNGNRQRTENNASKTSARTAADSAAIEERQARPAVAILPFENLTADESVDWLGTGIVESLTTDLRKLQAVQIASADRARAALQQAKIKDLSRSKVDFGLLTKQIGVQFLVTGSYQRDGDRLRVITHLYEAGTDELASASKADGTWGGIFKLQDKIARELIASLRLTMSARDRRRIAFLETGIIEAYELYSRARMKLYVMGKSTLEEARELFAQALALDPRYAMAHSGLGATHAMRFVHRSDPDDLQQARDHLERARALDAELPEPYPWLCYIYMREGRLQEALDAGHTAIRLLPDFLQAHYFLALVYVLRCETDAANYQSAVNHLLQAGRIEPRWQATWFVLSFFALLTGDYDRAEEFANRLCGADDNGGGMPPFIGREVLIGKVFLRRGNLEEACRWFTQSLQELSASDHMYRDGMRALSACGLGDVHLRQGNWDLALADYRHAWQIVQEYPTMLAQDRHSVRALAGLAAAYAAQGDRERGRQLLAQALRIIEKAVRPQSAAAGANLAELHFALAIAHVRTGDTDEAMESLEKAFHAGWLDADWWERDSEMLPLADHPRFLSLLGQIRRFGKLDFNL